MAQTIEGAVLCNKQSFDGTGHWSYSFGTGCYDETSYTWEIVDTLGVNNNAITSGSDDNSFWGAWFTETMACGDLGTEMEDYLNFDLITINDGFFIAEICFDYHVVDFNGVDEYIDIQIETSDGTIIESNVITGGISASTLTTNGWVTHCPVDMFR